MEIIVFLYFTESHNSNYDSRNFIHLAFLMMNIYNHNIICILIHREKDPPATRFYPPPTPSVNKHAQSHFNQLTVFCAYLNKTGQFSAQILLYFGHYINIKQYSCSNSQIFRIVTSFKKKQCNKVKYQHNAGLINSNKST